MNSQEPGNPRAAWQAFIERCDPEQPAVDEHLRAPRPHSPYGEILEALDTPGRPAKVLLTGIMGSGKSTELVRVARTRDAHDFVVNLDLSRAFSSVIQDTAALQHVTAWEICYLAGLSVMALAEERGIVEWKDEDRRDLLDAWRGATSEQPPANIDVVALGRQLLAGAGIVATAAASPVTGAALAGVSKLAEGFALRIGLKDRRDLPGQDESLRNLLAVVNRIIGTVQTTHRRVLIVLDGLDRIEEFSRARAIFIDSDLLGRLNAALVVCGPFLPHRYLATANVRAFQRTRLLCEPVLAESSGIGGRLLPGRALPFFRDVFHRRADDLELGNSMTVEQLDRVALYSGGRIRLYVRMLRQVAQEGWRSDLKAMPDTAVEKVLQRERLDVEEALNRNAIETLRSVMEDPRHELPDDDVVMDLLQTGRLLPYPNGSEWFFPHPLLTLNKLPLEFTPA